MKNPLRLLLPVLLILLGPATGHAQPSAASAPAASGYKVNVEISLNEQGQAEAVKLLESDDPTGAQLLNKIAIDLARQVKQPPRLVDGKPVKFKARAPFNFPVEGDEGPAANNAPKPSVHFAGQPVYPAELAAAGTAGGAILELIITAEGRVSRATVLRASHPEFGQAAQSAVLQWEFTPAKKDGVPVECRWRIAVDFLQPTKDIDWKWCVAPRPSLGSYSVVHRPDAGVVPADNAGVVAPAAGK
jgi:TonB family protein